MSPLPQKPESVKQESRWKDCQGYILANNGKQWPVQGKRYGALFIHDPLVGDPGEWTLSHYHTGLAITWTNTLEDAEKIGEVLWRFTCLNLRFKTKKEVMQGFPYWVRNWIRACKREWEYIPWEQFKT